MGPILTREDLCHKRSTARNEESLNMAASKCNLDEYLDRFMQDGYVVVRGALSPVEVAGINEGIDAARLAHPEEWVINSRRGHDAVGRDAPGVMERTDALDGVVHHPSVIPLVKAILGEGCLCSGLSYLRREPCLADPPEDIDGGDPLALSRVWHREDSGNVEGAEWNDYFTPAIQAIYYLDDVDETTHCTSVIPESAATKQSLPRTTEGLLRIDDHETGYVNPEKPRWMNSFGQEYPRRIGRVDVQEGAGSAIVFNNASFHCGTIRKTERIRRTVHVRYRQPEPARSNHAMSTYSREVGHTVADFQAALPTRASIGTI